MLHFVLPDAVNRALFLSLKHYNFESRLSPFSLFLPVALDAEISN
jgi:hypothetical protein